MSMYARLSAGDELADQSPETMKQLIPLIHNFDPEIFSGKKNGENEIMNGITISTKSLIIYIPIKSGQENKNKH